MQTNRAATGAAAAAVRGLAGATALGIAACLAVTAWPARTPAEQLPEGLELLARPPPSAAPHLPVDTTADASKLLIDVGNWPRAAVVDTAGVHELPLPAEAYSRTNGRAISAGGEFVVGTSDRSSPTRAGDAYAVLWREGVPSVLPDLTPVGGSSVAADVTEDGRVVVGSSRRGEADSWRPTAVRWVDGVVEALPVPPEADESSAMLVSDDGSTIIGSILLADHQTSRLVRWRNGQVEYLPPDPEQVPRFVPTWVSSDGSVVLGWQNAAESDSARLDESGWTVIEDLPTGPRRSALESGSDDGRVATGRATTGADPADCSEPWNCLALTEAFVWTEATGTRRLKDLLVEGCGYAIEPWTIQNAWISRDARHVTFFASGPELPATYVRAFIGNCPFDHPEPDQRPGPGSVFVSLQEHRAIFHIDPKGSVRLLASNAAIPKVLDIELGPHRWLYALGWDQLARVGIDDGESTLVASSGLMGSMGRYAKALAIGRDGTPYVLANGSAVAGLGEARLVRIDPATGEQTLAATFAGFGTELEREPGGTLAVLLLDGPEFDLYRFDPSDGSSTQVVGGTAGGGLAAAAGLAVGRDGELFTGFDSDSIQRIDPLAGIARRITTGPTRHDSRVLDVDPSGAPLLWEVPGLFLLHVDPDTGATSTGFGSVWLGSEGPHASAVAVLRPECSDGLDNDGDGRVDEPSDPGCSSADDDSEHVRDDVKIDVEPLRADDRIALGTQRPIQVALLGSSSLDARDVDPVGLSFGPGGATPRERRARLLDVNADGFRDAVVSFDLAETGIALGDREACMSGELAGDAFRACDAIEVVAPGCGRGHEIAFIAPLGLWIARRRRDRGRS